MLRILNTGTSLSISNTSPTGNFSISTSPIEVDQRFEFGLVNEQGISKMGILIVSKIKKLHHDEFDLDSLEEITIEVKIIEEDEATEELKVDKKFSISLKEMESYEFKSIEV